MPEAHANLASAYKDRLAFALFAPRPLPPPNTHTHTKKEKKKNWRSRRGKEVYNILMLLSWVWMTFLAGLWKRLYRVISRHCICALIFLKQLVIFYTHCRYEHIPVDVQLSYIRRSLMLYGPFVPPVFNAKKKGLTLHSSNGILYL